jgi:N utilization substance protein B
MVKTNPIFFCINSCILRTQNYKKIPLNYVRILIKMAIAELMNFNSIPGKVTLNEYVEISKTYSTDKSKDFINGILDRLFKQLTEDQKILKEGRGLLDS